ncbi:hypothetical protein BJ875DRAFT_285697 [Amylocarpus encephaloides]|uniref:Zn(2)-C6 fungal-type domain-containing protein n=1 Tax=Amylocarpus encephaloides TaxID=45428 RepID=A0A9P8CB59_9HELO|nr:hypothetical protein BJ875DRAFT_285697 [Amylocarpus encephaloides]
MSPTPRNGPGWLPRRRNGKQQACEPCRKAKIACDHSLPICDRCKRRKFGAQCIYLSAPMTRPTGTSIIRTQQDRSEEEHRPHNITSTPPISTSASVASASPQTTSPLQNHGPRNSFPRTPLSTEELPNKSAGGFFGPTSFSAVFLENKHNLGTNNADLQISNDSAELLPLQSLESLQPQTFLMLAGSLEQGSNPRIALGAKLLKAFPDRHTFNFLLEWYYEKCHEQSFLKHSVMSCANSIWTTYGSYFKEPRTKEGMERVSKLLCENSQKVLQEPGGSEDYARWLESFSGENLRWEILGIVYSALTNATLSLPERDAFFCTQKGVRRDRKVFAVEMKDCVQACVTLSNYMDLINFPMVALLTKNLILQTVISGDTSLVVWRQLGDLLSSSTALGLHRQLVAGQPITFITELKKRLFTVIFNLDKSSSLLTGRPPALSYRYTRFTHPLDLSDDVIMHGGNVLNDAISRLDADGWNTDGNIYQATGARARGKLSIVLDEILELSLGDHEDCTEHRIRILLDRLQHTYSSFPSFLHFSLTDPRIKDLPDYDFWKTLGLRLTFLEHRLLLERLAHKQNVLDGQSMVDCAREILELVVLIWVQRDRFVEHQHDFDWMLMCWGVPSAGVLCVELLKQLKHPQLSGPRLARSEIVQNLSLLIGFLEWVRPAAGNYQLCGRMRLIIKRILDQILDPSPPTSQPGPAAAQAQPFMQQESAQTSIAADMPITGHNFDAGTIMGPFDTAIPPPAAFDTANYDGLLDDLDWLNNVDWSRGPYHDATGQEFSIARWGNAF